MDSASSVEAVDALPVLTYFYGRSQYEQRLG